VLTVGDDQHGQQGGRARGPQSGAGDVEERGHGRRDGGLLVGNSGGDVAPGLQLVRVPPLVRHDPRRQAQVAGIVKPPLPLTISRNPKLFLRMLTKQVIPFRW
jgi:hypothetical protein